MKDIEIEVIHRLESAETAEDVLIAVEMLDEEMLETPVSQTLYATAGYLMAEMILAQRLEEKALDKDRPRQ
ncbi:MAG: hypothetical protein J07AB43_01110 [Candidatus Nanosalina sp. J07AB43]|jgi:hypothetical protein|nr:MAG: hypothetical protein J07AB43_01110 [Candidatus Nanosalina sp. J07AB43]